MMSPFLMRVCDDPPENLLAVNHNVWWADETKFHAIPASSENPDFNGSVNENLLVRLSGEYEHCGSSLSKFQLRARRHRANDNLLEHECALSHCPVRRA
jgi:hypothetical protein